MSADHGFRFLFSLLFYSLATQGLVLYATSRLAAEMRLNYPQKLVETEGPSWSAGPIRYSSTISNIALGSEASD